MKKIEQEAEEDVMKNEVDIFIVKKEMEIVINKSLCEEVEFLRFCFFFAFEEKKKHSNVEKYLLIKIYKKYPNCFN